MIGLRLRELEIIFWSRYGGRRLPPDDSGTDDAMMALHHLAGLTIDPRGRMTTWLSTWAPWMMPPGEAAGLIERAIAKPTRYQTDTLARRLNLHLAERTLLNVTTTIGAVDKPKKQRDAESAGNKIASRKRSSAELEVRSPPRHLLRLEQVTHEALDRRRLVPRIVVSPPAQDGRHSA